MTATDSLLHVARDARGVATLTLNDPARFNALGSDMLAALQQALDGVAGDESARVVVLAANGRAFCAGHNLKDMAQNPELAYYQQLFAQCSRVMLAIHQLPVPVIARVHGMATAAGCQLVAQCDLAVASDAASFATSGIHYGLFCATPSVPLVRNVPAKQAMEMLLTGDFIDARTALERGWSTAWWRPRRWTPRWRSSCSPSWTSRAWPWPWARRWCTSSASWASRPPTSSPGRPWPSI